MKTLIPRPNVRIHPIDHWQEAMMDLPEPKDVRRLSHDLLAGWLLLGAVGALWLVGLGFLIGRLWR